MTRCLLAGMALMWIGALLPTTATAQEEKPEPKQPKGIDKATVEAWAKRGFKPTWLGVSQQSSQRPLTDSWKLAVAADPKNLEAVVPAFVLDRDFVAKNKVTLNDLPPVDVPFGLMLNSGPALDELQHLAALKNLTRLHTGDIRLTDDALQHLAALKGLTALAIAGNARRVTGEGLKHLAGLTNLTHLDLPVNDIAGDGLKHLAGLKKLTHLNLRENYKFTGEGLSQFTELTHLNLAATRVTNESLAALAGMKNLASLDLNNAFTLTGDGLKHIAGLPNLTTLNLLGTRLRAPDLAHLTGLKKLATLELSLGYSFTDEALGHLHANGLLHVVPHATAADGKRPTKPDEVAAFDLSRTAATDEGAKFLTGLPNLTTLKLKSLGPAQGAGFKQLAGLKKLTAIHLPAEMVTDQLLKALDEAGLMYCLAPWVAGAGAARPTKADEVVAVELPGRLDGGFAGTKVTDAGLKHLAGFANLTSLNLKNSAVTGDGLAALAGLKNLTSLDLSGSQMTRDNLKHIAGLKNLETLALRQIRTGTTGLSADELKHLAGLQKLTTLDLTGTRVQGQALGKLAGLGKLATIQLDEITDDSLEGLRDAGLLHALPNAEAVGGKRATKDEEIDVFRLADTKVTDKGLKHLFGLTNLTFVTLKGTKISDSGMNELKRALPKCVISK